MSEAGGPPTGFLPPYPPPLTPRPPRRNPAWKVLLAIGLALVIVVGVFFILGFGVVLLYARSAGHPDRDFQAGPYVVSPVYVVGRGSDVVLKRFPCPNLVGFPGMGTVRLTHYKDEDDDDGSVLWEARARVSGTQSVTVGNDKAFRSVQELQPLPKSGETVVSFSAWGDDDQMWETDYWPELVSDGVGYLDTSGGLKRGSEADLLAREPSDLDCP